MNRRSLSEIAGQSLLNKTEIRRQSLVDDVRSRYPLHLMKFDEHGNLSKEHEELLERRCEELAKIRMMDWKEIEEAYFKLVGL